MKNIYRFFNRYFILGINLSLLALLLLNIYNPSPLVIRANDSKPIAEGTVTCTANNRNQPTVCQVFVTYAKNVNLDECIGCARDPYRCLQAAPDIRYCTADASNNWTCSVSASDVCGGIQMDDSPNDDCTCNSIIRHISVDQCYACFPSPTPIPTNTPSFTPTPTPTTIPTQTPTFTPIPPSSTPTPTPTSAQPSPTVTPTPTITNTPTPTPTIACYLEAPSNLQLTCQDNNILLTWTDNSNNENDFKVFRTEPTPEEIVGYNLGPNATSFLYPSITYGTKYCFYVRSYIDSMCQKSTWPPQCITCYANSNTPTPTNTPTGTLTPTYTPTNTPTPTQTPTIIPAVCNFINVSPDSGNRDLFVMASINGQSNQNLYKFDWGDGSYIENLAQTYAYHTYTTSGTFKIIGYVKNSDNNWITSPFCQKSVTVTNPPTTQSCATVCSLTANPNGGTEPINVNIQAIATTTCSSISKVHINYADGSQIETIHENIKDIIRTHTYNRGVYYPSITFIDSQNNAVTCTAPVSVSSKPTILIPPQPQQQVQGSYSKGGEVVYVNPPAQIPDTGSPTFITLFSVLTGAVGIFLKRQTK